MKRILVAVMACVAVWLVSATGRTQQPDPIFVPGEALVKFRSTASNARRTAALASQGANVIRHLEALDIDHLRLAPGQNVEATVAALQANPDVESAQPNYIRQHTAPPPPNDPRWLDDTLWGLITIQAHPTWTTFSTGSSGVVVADIDTGVDYTHPDLAANMWHNPLEVPGDGIDNDSNGWIDDVFGIDVVNGDGDPMDDNNHGTHTSGTIGGVGNDGVGIVGVNWTTRILACKFLNAAGSGSDAGAATCFNYIVALKQRGENIRVSSNSWGGGGGGATLRNAIDNAGNNGIINIFAAGNNGRDIDAIPFYPASHDLPSIVSVGASTQTDARASFSNWGLTSVDLAAPGVSIYSTIRSGGYAFFNGTSMATPHVAGAAAILYAMDPNLSVTSVKNLLMNNVDLVPAWSGLSVTGGRLNLFKAAQAVGGGGGGPSAIFVGTDTTTKGDWPGGYGLDGYNVIGDAVSYPSYALVTPTGQSTFVWAASTSDVRALQKVSAPGRIAATWYGGTFDIDLNLTDGLAHKVSFYSVDWDTTSRSQRFDILNAATSAVLDTRTLTGFNGGSYLVWTITGHVKVRVTSLAGPNAVVSGLFFGQGNQPPIVSITAPTEGATFLPGSTIHLAANASDPDGTINSVAFHINGSPTPLFTDTTAPYEFDWPSVPAGAYSLTAVATDDDLRTTTSAPVNFTVSSPGGGSSAVFIGSDGTTQGSWQGAFGADGYNVIGDAVSYPAYASVSPSGQSTFVWNPSTSDVRALQKASGPGRIAATWYGGLFNIDVNLLDGMAHPVSFYSLDWDTTTRVQRYDILDATSMSLLDSRTISSFQNGVYLKWTITGHVIVRVTSLGGANAVVGGLFFGAAGGQPPVVSITDPTEGATFLPGSTIHLAANASDPDGTINSVAFHINGSPTPLFTDTAAPYEFNWPSVPAGAYTLTAVATDNELRQTTSSPVNFTVTAGGGTTVVFVGTDTTTQGTWPGTYGTDGYNIINDGVSLPAYASLAPIGESTWTWAASTSDVRALRKAGSSDRIAATWYGATFDIDVNLLDGLPHEVALYSVDFDTTLRSQRFDVLDAVTSAVLDTRTISGFNGGQYLVWRITGHVKVRVTRLVGANAVVSGVFFDPPTAPLPLTWLSSMNSGAYSGAGTDVRHGSALLVRDLARRASSTAASGFSVPVFTKPGERHTSRR